MTSSSWFARVLNPPLVSHAGFHRAPPKVTLLTAQQQDVVSAADVSQQRSRVSDHLLSNPQARAGAQAELGEDVAGSCTHPKGQASDEITRRALNARAQIEADRVGT